MAKVVQLWSEGGDSMVSSWRDYLLATKCKDGTFSVRARRRTEEKTWWYIHRVSRIRTAQQFVDAVRACWDEAGMGADDIRVILGPLRCLDPVMADAVHAHLELKADGSEDTGQ